MLLHADDDLVVSENAESMLRNETCKHFELNEESFRPPNFYLGGSTRKLELENGVDTWAFSSIQHATDTTQSVEHLLRKLDKKVTNRANATLRTNHRTELGATPEFTPGSNILSFANSFAKIDD